MTNAARLPNAGRAVVDVRKIRDFILNPDHLDNKGRADFFFRFGFSRDNRRELRVALTAHAMSNPVVALTNTGHGRRYRLQCSVPSPDGRNPCITAVWISNSLEETPRLVTAFPGPRPRQGEP